ncbi:uncharacterized protein LOC126568253 [Anopheles maculipalpis]|uniref:uncharacterized protein LOC126568253 n=1 Tax=Anopheles maculipalpis TaxID=1496333 RepID=UPI002158F145|nr:uncharacterized protein LOC126568253 [Anopheles maculipalpis]
MASIRVQPPQPPARAMALVLAIASLLATSYTAIEAVTDLETRCQNVQCYIDCPSDSYLQSTMHAPSYAKEDVPEPSETFDRERRAIATNNHPHKRITIVPTEIKLLHFNNMRRRRDTDTIMLVEAAVHYNPENDPNLQELCCPKCVCQPCPEMPSCPPNFKRIVDTHEQTGQPGNCCPSFHCKRNQKCRSDVNNASYVENETWSEGDCTECKCLANRRQCVISACKPLNCEHTIKVPGRCCPVCDPTRSIFCEDHNCDLQCRNGYERRGNCSLCSCVQLMPPKPTTDKTTETPALKANFTSGSVEQPDTDEQEEHNGRDGDAWLSNWITWVVVAFGSFIVLGSILIYVSGSAERSGVSIEKIKKGLQMLFSCNEIPQRKSAYNRVSSTGPATPPATETTANSVA